MDKYAERRKHFKTPPADSRQSQEARRAQLLEEQKRKRTQQVDTFRQLDQFSGLSLDDSDDEVEEDDGRTTSMNGVAQFASMLQPNDADTPPDSRTPSPRMDEDNEDTEAKQERNKKKRKGRVKNKPSKWANKCMYAELLEMREDSLWAESFDIGEAPVHDGLPDDLETAWVGLAPVPVGKRCLAVTMQSPGLSGFVSNTVLRSRLLGKVILRPFPSPLPANTILDCILDENWKSNGILHVLDVVRWKGQDVAGCEASFRFWWRDTRLSEVPTWPLPPPHKSSFKNTSSGMTGYVFPYPTTLVPVPYITPLPFETILNEVLNMARHGRTLLLSLPIHASTSVVKEDMEVDRSFEHAVTGGDKSGCQRREMLVPISSDGLLLYFGEATYESGVSPLSVWVPRVSFARVHHAKTDIMAAGQSHAGSDVKESPLDTFERLVHRRLIALRTNANAPGTTHGTTSCTLSTVEVDMNT